MPNALMMLISTGSSPASMRGSMKKMSTTKLITRPIIEVNPRKPAKTIATAINTSARIYSWLVLMKSVI